MEDPSPYIVVIAFLVGVIMMVSSGRVGELAGIPFSRRPQEAARAGRIAQISLLTLGSTTATLMAATYLLFHFLRIGA